MAFHQILAALLIVAVLVGAVVLIRRDFRRQRARREAREQRSLNDMDTVYGWRSDGSRVVVTTVEEEPQRQERRPQRGPRGRHLRLVRDDERRAS